MTKPNTTKPTKAQALEQKAQADERLKKFKVTAANSAAHLNAVVTARYAEVLVGDVDVFDLTDALKDSIKAVQDGNMTGMEALLVSQAKTLQTMFVNFAARASSQTGLAQLKTLTNLAFKAQAQSRATVEALIALKYPKQVIVTQQANIASGHQQINNGVANQDNLETSTRTHAPAHAEEKQIEPNKLMEINH